MNAPVRSGPGKEAFAKAGPLIAAASEALWRAGQDIHGLGRAVTPRQRRFAGGVGGALVVHVLLLMALIYQPAARQVGLGPSDEQGGRPQAFNGWALTPVIISLAGRDTLGREATPNDPVERQAASAATPGAPEVLHVAATPSELALSTGAEGLSQGKAVSSEQVQATPAAAPAVAGESLQAAVQSGDSEAAQNLLRQIARCLPRDKRPVIDQATLTIQLDASGALAAAPGLDMSLAFASPEAIVQANTVIQAALQCGPYDAPGGAGADFRLKPDFSFLGARQVVADGPSDGGRHGR
jgi:hypothetical protein